MTSRKSWRVFSEKIESTPNFYDLEAVDAYQCLGVVSREKAEELAAFSKSFDDLVEELYENMLSFCLISTFT